MNLFPEFIPVFVFINILVKSIHFFKLYFSLLNCNNKTERNSTILARSTLDFLQSV